ncbi:MAG: flagellar filament capping protein FliD [Bacteriovoracaceae bacterium]|nr:flagellar filament capping protein FliD [Bacteriovoracaceae bacterium]
MSISFGSINTGLPKDIVKQIISAEQIPVQNMEKQKSKIQEKKTLVDQLVKLVEDVRGNLTLNASARSLRELKVDTNDDIVGVAIDKNRAVPGAYQVEVMALAQKSSAMSSGFADKDESYVGVGFIQYSLPNGETKDIYVDSDNSSLSAISKLINKDTSLGVTANVINDGSGSDTPWRLILSLNKTGDDAAVDFPYFYFVDGEDDFQLEFQREAHDAKVKLDGFEIEAPENKITDLIPGVTIDLKKAKPGEEFTIKISEDVQAVGAKVSDLVTKINGVLSFIKQQNTMDEKTDTSRTLGGDIMLQSLESRIHSAVFKDVLTDKGYLRAGDLGLSFNRNGALEFDDKKFAAKITEDYNTVTQILTGTFTEEGGKTEGFMDNLSAMVGTALRVPDGLVQSRKKTLQSNIEQIDRRITQKQKYIEEKEKNLKDKFARLEGTISRIRSQGAGVAAMGGSGGDPVQQLG